jgi:hypothetical protein
VIRPLEHHSTSNRIGSPPILSLSVLHLSTAANCPLSQYSLHCSTQPGRSRQQCSRLQQQQPDWLSRYRLQIQAQAFWGSRSGGLDVSCSSDSEALYAYALDLARQENYGAARDAFEVLLMCHPDMCKAWVSYAQVSSVQQDSQKTRASHSSSHIVHRHFCIALSTPVCSCVSASPNLYLAIAYP